LQFLDRADVVRALDVGPQRTKTGLQLGETRSLGLLRRIVAAAAECNERGGGYACESHHRRHRPVTGFL
jgi:hypothetical protein